MGSGTVKAGCIKENEMTLYVGWWFCVKKNEIVRKGERRRS
jgi:hypothetical protein